MSRLTKERVIVDEIIKTDTENNQWKISIIRNERYEYYLFVYVNDHQLGKEEKYTKSGANKILNLIKTVLK